MFFLGGQKKNSENYNWIGGRLLSFHYYGCVTDLGKRGEKIANNKTVIGQFP